MNRICAVMVVRSEAYYLRLSLACALRHSDHVFVLDTGSTDESMQILASELERVGPARLAFEQRDFGGSYNFEGGSYPTNDPRAYREMEARNYALERAEQLFDPDWMVRLDVDETMAGSLFDIMRRENNAPSLRFNCELALHYGPPLRLYRENGSCDPHVFAWDRRKGSGRWTHPSGQHVCLTGPGFGMPRMISEPVQFHWHRVFGPKSIYTYLWWESAAKARAEGREHPGYGCELAAIPWMNRKTRFDMPRYRESLPRYFDADGRFIVRKVAHIDLAPHSMPWTEAVLDDDVLSAWKSFITYE
jgi:glycosyltransferase involved in cell wall biosynthesis